MEDSLGLYYLPRPDLPAVRMYVRAAEDGSPEFRMWDAEHPEVWERHQWISMEVVAMATGLFKGDHDEGWHPERLYDAAVAKALLSEKRGK